MVECKLAILATILWKIALQLATGLLNWLVTSGVDWKDSELGCIFNESSMTTTSKLEYVKKNCLVLTSACMLSMGGGAMQYCVVTHVMLKILAHATMP